ncbi:MAG: hypothetical protein WCF57_10370 [Pyrinomonadaceae bacterium]
MRRSKSTERIEGAAQARGVVPLSAYLFALAMGTLAFFGTVSLVMLIFMATPPFPLWIDPFFLPLFAVSYLLMAALFSLLWPDVSWKWGLWLSLPCLLAVSLVYLVNTPDGAGILHTIIGTLLIVLLPACACALLGKRFAPCDQLASSTPQAFTETITSEQAITAHFAADERLKEVDKGGVAASRQVDSSIPTPLELSELFQRFQLSKTTR